MQTKVLITGVAGFIGSNLADRLLQEGKYRVIGIDNLAYGIKEQIPAGVEFHKIDIRDRSIYPIFQNVDYVFHFAAKNCISDCQLDPVETADINVTGTVNVFEASRRANVNKVIYAESSALYEGSTILPTPESEAKPQSFYSVSKFSSMYFAEAYARFFGAPQLHNSIPPSLHNSITPSLHHSNTPTGFRATALRYFCVYGPRQDYRRTIPPLFSAIIIRLLRGEQPTIYGTGEKRRDFIHVDDINDFHIKCMTDERTTGNVYNLGSGINFSVNEIYEIIGRLLKTDKEPLYKPDLPGEAFANLADISAAKNLGWSPKISLEDGLKSSIDFLRKEIERGNVA
jgi:UDP-glucose 4-epimerase